MKIAYLFIDFPTLSQTFLQREIRGIAAAGIEVEVHSMWTSPDAPPWEPVPGVTLRQWSRASHLFRAPKAALEAACRPALLGGALRVKSAHPLRRAEDAKYAALGASFALGHAAEFRRAEFDLIHGPWATAPATAALLLGRLCGLPFSFGAHAYDIHRNGGDLFLDYKLRRAALIHTTTQMNVDYLSGRVPEARERIVLSRRGLAALPPLETARPLATPLHILSVGRLIPKKGHDRQIAAIGLLKRQGIAATLRIVGDGPLREALQNQIATAGLEDAVTLAGPLPEATVREEYRRTDFFWHAGIVDAEGDRDGLPNVIPEAMAHGVPVISSDASGTTEAVHDGQTGLLAPGATAEALAGAVKRLADDATLRERVRAGAHAWVAENFLVERNAARLAAAFRQAAG